MKKQNRQQKENTTKVNEFITVEEQHAFFRSLTEELYKLYKDHESKNNTHSMIHYFYQAWITARTRTEMLGGKPLKIEEEMQRNIIYNDYTTLNLEYKQALEIALKTQIKKDENEIIQYLETAKRIDPPKKQRFRVNMKKYKGSFGVIA